MIQHTAPFVKWKSGGALMQYGGNTLSSSPYSADVIRIYLVQTHDIKPYHTEDTHPVYRVIPISP